MAEALYAVLERLEAAVTTDEDARVQLRHLRQHLLEHAVDGEVGALALAGLLGAGRRTRTRRSQRSSSPTPAPLGIMATPPSN